MKYDRNEMLAIFLANSELKELSSLNEAELYKVNFSDNTNDIVVEAIKSLLLSFCNAESDTLTLRQINLRIESLSK
jgi:hypothetical protein